MARTAEKPKEGIGARVERERIRRGWSQEDLADKLHVTRSSIKNKELGERPFSLEEACDLSELFGMTLDELVNGVKTKNVQANRDLGLDDDAVETLSAFRMLWEEEGLSGINRALASIEALDALSRFMNFIPEQQDYFLSNETKGSGQFMICSMSPVVYDSLLEQNLLRVLRLAKEGKHTGEYYSNLKDYLLAHQMDLRLAESVTRERKKGNGEEE